jgi:cyclopropane fatty-acyl-phospholipid synthase-like methyltransferase
MIREGARALGFGCGAEPLPSYFAANGIRVTVTDLPTDEAAAQGWVSTNQHASGPENAFMSHLVSRERFDEMVDMKFVDMNAIPEALRDYDFCWSICALEHLGSIERGLTFIERSLDTLRPGGVSVHTTEFNIRPDGPTIDNWPTVAFQKHHMESLVTRLEQHGHHVVPFEFDLGDGPLDRFVDVPPHHHDLPPELRQWLGDPLHLKLANDGIVVTCVGIIVEKSPKGV